MKGKRINFKTVIIPCYNESKMISKMLEETVSILDERYGRRNYEIIVIDDGSSDNSAEVVRASAEKMSCIQDIILPHNVGKGRVIQIGFKAARGDFIIFIDGDLEIHPSNIIRFFDILESPNGSDVVVGSKYCKDGIKHLNLLRSAFSRGYWIINKTLFGLVVQDTQMGIKAFKSEVIEKVVPRLTVSGYAFDIELLVHSLKGGFNIK